MLEGKLALRLPPPEPERFLERYQTTRCEHGVVMKEYVDVPDALFSQTAELQPYFAASMAYVRTLMPKRIRAKKS